jgi:hypothetical protein
MRLSRPVSVLFAAFCAAGGGGCTHKNANAEKPKCGLATDLGALSPPVVEASAAIGIHADVKELNLSAPLASSIDPPVLQVAASAGQGAFAQGIAVGSFSMTPTDLDPLTCSFCVTIVGPISPETRQPIFTYAASRGSLTVAELGSRIKGSLKNVELYEVRYDADHKKFVDAPTGCKSHIGEVTFLAPLESFRAP